MNTCCVSNQKQTKNFLHLFLWFGGDTCGAIPGYEFKSDHRLFSEKSYVVLKIQTRISPMQGKCLNLYTTSPALQIYFLIKKIKNSTKCIFQVCLLRPKKNDRSSRKEHIQHSDLSDPANLLTLGHRTLRLARDYLFLFVCFGLHPAMLRAYSWLRSGITLVGTPGIICGARDLIQGCNMQGKHLTCYTISLALQTSWVLLDNEHIGACLSVCAHPHIQNPKQIHKTPIKFYQYTTKG